MPVEHDDTMDGAIAVVGMAGRFAGARDLDELWELLRDGREGIARLSDEQLLAAGVAAALLADPRYVKAQAAVADVEWFDGAFFGFTPRECEIASPPLRLLLEASWHALEDAGCDPSRFAGAIGVFVSASFNPYVIQLFSQPQLVRDVGGFRVHLANDRDFLPTWISYKLGLKGPSVNVQTACSSSLVAVHLACQSLLNGECDLALAGAASVRSLGPSGYLFQDGGILSPDGHCRAFDAAAGGTVDGDGVGMVALKRLADARRDRDRLRAVIRGSAINNDGAAKIGFTAPGLEGQTRVISEALAIAGVDPATVTYVEAHGTGTRLGDPAEVAALTAAFRGKTQRQGFCAVGSVKTNLGHLDAAAGLAGLIKVVLSLEHRQLPPSLHFATANPEIDFAASPFYVNAALAPWPASAGRRRAGVSSFGIGGTNAHAILEEAPEDPVAPETPETPETPEINAGVSRSSSWQLAVCSARSPAALEAATAALAGALRRPRLNLADAAFTLQNGRRQFAHRRALVCRDAADAAEVLAAGGRWVHTSRGEARPGPVAFLFPGQGAQSAGMSRELHGAAPRFRAELDRCAQILAPHLGGDVREVLHAAAPDGRLDQTAWAQPALFAVDYALARLWMSWGLQPRALLGHSIGEYVAACLAGVFELEEALALVAFRARLVQGLPAGGMTAVALGEAEVAPRLDGELSLAAVNGPGRTVVAGGLAALGRLEARLAEEGIQVRRLRTSHAFHSPMVEPILPAFAERLARVALRPPRIPFVSNLTGDWIEESQATDPAYWVRHLREPVRFGAGVERLLAADAWRLLEVGPGQTLAGLVRRSPGLRPETHAVVSSLARLPGADSEVASLLDALGRLWVAGVEIDWRAVSRAERRRRIALPGYPFERQRHWVEARRHDPHPPAAAAATATAAPGAPAFAVEAAAAVLAPRFAGAPPADDGAAAGLSSVVERIFARQLHVLSEQLRLLRGPEQQDRS